MNTKVLIFSYKSKKKKIFLILYLFNRHGDCLSAGFFPKCMQRLGHRAEWSQELNQSLQREQLELTRSGREPRYSEVGYRFPRHFTCYNKYLPLNDSLLLAFHMYGERCTVISTLSHYFDVCMCV